MIHWLYGDVGGDILTIGGILNTLCIQLTIKNECGYFDDFSQPVFSHELLHAWKTVALKFYDWKYHFHTWKWNYDARNLKKMPKVFLGENTMHDVIYRHLPMEIIGTKEIIPGAKTLIFHAWKWIFYAWNFQATIFSCMKHFIRDRWRIIYSFNIG